MSDVKSLGVVQARIEGRAIYERRSGRERAAEVLDEAALMVMSWRAEVLHRLDSATDEQEIKAWEHVADFLGIYPEGK